MKDIETIIKLLDAGYSKAEIDQMTAEPAAPAADPEPAAPAADPEPAAPAADPEPAPAADHEPAAQTSVPEVTTNAQIEAFQKSMNDFILKLQKMNVMNDDSAGKKTVKTDEEIISKIIGG
jgi:2-oxoglutarate dehydrogenase E2 component (dihydrolipoamide succinyltransferase)